MRRRDFLAATASTALIATSASVPQFLLRAAEATPRRGDSIVVVVQLSGGNDGLNTVIPVADEQYRRRRPTLGIPRDQALRINDQLSFHPALRGFSKLLDDGRLAILPGIGYPNPNRSHFESMDIWHTARREPVGRATGWLGRMIDATPSAAGAEIRAIHVGGEVQPLALSALNTPAVSIRSLERFRLDGFAGERREQLESTVAAARDGGSLLEFVRTSSLGALAASRQIEATSGRGSTGVTYPGTDLGKKLESVARLIDSGLTTRIYYTQLDGFDTHSTQPAAHASLLQQVGDAVEAFMNDLAKRGHGERVMLMAFSEFGRRVQENASLGTDHGAAGPLFVAGSRVKPGVHGAYPSLTDLDDGDLKFHTDFRRVYATLVGPWLGGQIEPIVGAGFEPLPILAGA